MWKKEEKSQKPCWYHYGCSLQASEINPAARWGLCLGNHCTEVKSECYLASLSTGCLRAGGCYCSFSAQAIEESLGIGSALCNVAATWLLRSLRPGGVGVQGLAGSAAPGPPRERGPAAENTALHWHGTRDTRKPSTTETRGRLRGGRAGSHQRKPSVCQRFTWTGFLGLWHFVSQCNFTRVRVCLCVRVCVSLQYKQKATTRRKLLNFKIWNKEQVNKIHSNMWLIVWIPYIKSQHIYLFSLSIKTSLMDKSSTHWISVLVILNPMKTHLFTTERTTWRVEHAVSF